VPLLYGLLIHSFFLCHFVFRRLCLVSASSKICWAPNWGACTYVVLGSWCRTADPAALAATTLASPLKLTEGCRPSASARFPLTCEVGSPYSAVTSPCNIDAIQVHFGKESVFIAQQRRTSRCWEKNGNILTCSAGTVRYRTVVAVPNSKYTYHVRLLSYLNQLVPDLTYIHIYLRTYIRTYIHKYVYTYFHTYIHTHLLYYICTYILYIPTYVQTYVRTYIHTYRHTYIHPYIHTFIHTECFTTCGH